MSRDAVSWERRRVGAPEGPNPCRRTTTGAGRQGPAGVLGRAGQTGYCRVNGVVGNVSLSVAGGPISQLDPDLVRLVEHFCEQIGQTHLSGRPLHGAALVTSRPGEEPAQVSAAPVTAVPDPDQLGESRVGP